MAVPEEPNQDGRQIAVDRIDMAFGFRSWAFLPSGSLSARRVISPFQRNQSLHPGLAAASFSMHLFVAFRAKRDQVLLRVATRVAAEFEVVYL